MADSQETALTPRLLNINPEPIGVYTFANNKHLEYKEILCSILEHAPTSFRQQHEDLTNHICNESDQNIFKDFPELTKLQEDITKMLHHYIQALGNSCDKLILHSAWLNKADKDATLYDHSHSNSFVSATYFVNFDNKVHTPLSFRNDRCVSGNTPCFPFMTVPEHNKNIYNSPYISINAKEGQILIWRSHLVHGYKKPNVEGNRITLSLNCMPKILDNGAYKFEIA